MKFSCTRLMGAAAASSVAVMLLSTLALTPAVAGDPAPCRRAFYSPASVQFPGTSIYPGNVYAVPSDSLPTGDLYPLSFLPSRMQVDAAHVLPDGSLVFSVDRNGYVSTASGLRLLRGNEAYRLTVPGGIEIEPLAAWTALDLGLSTLDALHVADDCVWFSVAAAQPKFGGGLYRPWEVYRACPGGPLELVFNAGASFGSLGVDALLIDGAVVEFSTIDNRYLAGGARIWNQNTYRCEPTGAAKTCSAGALAPGFDGVALGLRDLNAFASGDGLACDDQSACTLDDRCADAVCVGSDAVVCTPLDQCHVAGTCDPLSGSCSDPNAPEETPCDDGSVCSQVDVCRSGLCEGTDPLVCPAAACEDPGACDPIGGCGPATGKAEGTSCDPSDDGLSSPCAESSCVDARCVGSCRTVFATAEKFNGYLGGLAGADRLCNEAATAPGSLAPPGDYMAWLSTSATADPESRFEQSAVPYVRTDGQQLAADWADLTDGTLDAPIAIHEAGGAAGGRAWTATLRDGTWIDADSYATSCYGWTPPNTGWGYVGALGASDELWTEQTELLYDYYGDGTCSSTSYSVYCFQQSADLPCASDAECGGPACAPATCDLTTGVCRPGPVWNIDDGACDAHKQVFVSSLASTGNLGGVAGADATCQSLADDAGLVGSFKAWISSSASSPASTFAQSPDPYVLVDGTIVADSWADLTDGRLRARINLDETGATISGSAWTDTAIGGGASTTYENCDDWTNETYYGVVGSTVRKDVFWTDNAHFFSYSSNRCNESHHVYCIEQ